MNIICTFKSGEKKPLREIEKLVNSGQLRATKLDGTPFVFPVRVRSRSSLEFERPSPYEANGKRPAAFQLPSESGSEFKKCVLCSTNVALSRHHLVPRSKSHVRSQRGTIWVCKGCHTDVHWFFTNMELAVQFYDTDKLRYELEKRRKQYESKNAVAE